MHPRHPPAVAERGATGALRGGVAATPLLHTQNCGMSRDRGVATPWSATGGGGVASAPLSFCRGAPKSSKNKTNSLRTFSFGKEFPYQSGNKPLRTLVWHSCAHGRGPPVALHVSRYMCRSSSPQNPVFFFCLVS